MMREWRANPQWAHRLEAWGSFAFDGEVEKGNISL